MKHDDLDRLIDELAAEAISQSGQSNEYVRGLMANASAVLDRYRMACRLAGAIGVVLDQVQVICEAPAATPYMVDALREKGKKMWQAAQEHTGGPTRELLPCAFCGNQPVHSLNFKHSKNWHRFECERRFDGCPMNARTHHHETLEQAAVAWNTRTLWVLAPAAAAEARTP